MIYLRDIRQCRRITMKELGKKVGVSESAIGLYETGKRKPDYEMLLKLSEALKCSVDEILNGSKLVEPNNIEQNLEKLSDNEQKLLEAYREADPQIQKAVCRILDIPFEEDTTLSNSVG